MKIKMNTYKNDLYCVECKQKVSVGEKYAIVPEELYDDQLIYKEYHLDCIPPDEEDYFDEVNEQLDTQ